MELLSRNSHLLNALHGNLEIRDSQILGINIYEINGVVFIEVRIELLREKVNKRLLLKFSNVTLYAFFWKGSSYFYYIERYKFFENAGKYYISFDPVDEEDAVSDEDNDFLLADSVEGYFLKE